jgi:hypothetical protein
MKNVKAQAVKDWSATKTIVKNFTEFLDASCLMAVSTYAVYESLHHRREWVYEALLFAGLVIGLQAFVLLVRHFNK